MRATRRARAAHGASLHTVNLLVPCGLFENLDLQRCVLVYVEVLQ